MKTEQNKTIDDSIQMSDKINDVEMIKRKFMVLFCFRFCFIAAHFLFLHLFQTEVK